MRWITSLLLGCLTACAPDAAAPPAERIEVAPDAFALLPCPGLTNNRPCALVIAGGKRILFGAPGGLVGGLSESDLRQLDAVMVFSLHAADLEGLDDTRNASWRAGRDVPLMAVGPPGIEDVVFALNKAYEQADALRVVEEGFPPGGFDAAVLEARPATRGTKVFDTGDLQVERVAAGYLVTYEQEFRALLEGCGREPAGPIVESEVEVVRIGCDRTNGALAWPLSEPVFVTNPSP
ncbi:MAG: hypothetical protein NXH72_10560 [Hyphomonadaceae bacterium]|nr:hypothetical protein [Hyphomonadaceae bacterium]